MADYPCDQHKARYQGASHRFYINLYRGDDKIQLKGSLCEACLSVLMDDWLSWALYNTPEGWTFDPEVPPALDTLWMASDSPENTVRRLYRS